jgi:hypothetical protein
VSPDGVQKISALAAMINDWQVNGIFSAFSGSPFTVTADGTALNGPGGWNLDLSVFRSFPLGGTHRIEARVEASNVTNKTNFGNPTSNLQSGDLLRIFGLYSAFAERQIRLAVRYSF